MKLTKEQIKDSIKKIYITVTDEEAEIIQQQFNDFYIDVEELNKIKTNDVSSMDSPLKNSDHELRNDELIEENDEKVFANSKHFHKKYVEVK